MQDTVLSAGGAFQKWEMLPGHVSSGTRRCAGIGAGGATTRPRRAPQRLPGGVLAARSALPQPRSLRACQM